MSYGVNESFDRHGQVGDRFDDPPSYHPRGLGNLTESDTYPNATASETMALAPGQGLSQKDRFSSVPLGLNGGVPRGPSPLQTDEPTWSAQDIDGGVGRSDLEGEGSGDHLKVSVCNRLHGTTEKVIGKAVGKPEMVERGEERKLGLA